MREQDTVTRGKKRTIEETVRGKNDAPKHD